ncbi:MAG: dehydrogenase [Actinobacteria bacterium]|nr:MAG: dehydrogenase [Actinomycetota bacterium]
MTGEQLAAGSGGNYDVIILGGGLAGLTLGLQLKRARPETTIFIAEKRPGPAPEAAFKVGESTVEVSAHYFAEVVGMKDHIEADQLHKAGLRYFFPAGDNTDIAERLEWGVPFFPPNPSYQLDRGRFENELAKRNLDAGVELVQGAFIDTVELGDDEHSVTIVRGGPGGERTTVRGRWIVDSSGRAFLLKRKLGLEQDNGHNVNSAWFRLAGGIDIEDWVDESNTEWFERMKQRGLRRLSTNHLMGQGYWVWLIPLSSGSISIGIVSDERFHPFEQIETLDGALEWLREHEPQLAAIVDSRRDGIEDFLRIKDFSYGCKQVYSADRWALTGEAGPFLDPFYSPGSDFIAVGNTLVTDLVVRDLNGEDVAERTRRHDDLFLRLYKEALTWYEGQYEMWGDPQVMIAKIAANNIMYWSTTGLLFFHHKLADTEFMAEVMPEVERIWALNARLEALFLEWFRMVAQEWRHAYVPTVAFPGMGMRHVELTSNFDDQALKAKLTEDRELMEAVAVAIFHKAASFLPEGAPDPETKINPYAIGLDSDRWEQDGLFKEPGLAIERAHELAPGITNLWVDKIAQPA